MEIIGNSNFTSLVEVFNKAEVNWYACEWEILIFNSSSLLKVWLAPVFRLFFCLVFMVMTFGKEVLNSRTFVGELQWILQSCCLETWFQWEKSLRELQIAWCHFARAEIKRSSVLSKMWKQYFVHTDFAHARHLLEFCVYFLVIHVFRDFYIP